MVKQESWVFFLWSAFSNAGKMMTVFRKGTLQCIRRIVPSDPSALIRRLNGFPLHEHCEQKYTRLVTV